MRETIGKTEAKHPGADNLPLITREYDSMMEFCSDAKKGYTGGTIGGFGDFYSFSSGFTHVRTWEELETLCRDGWEEKLPEVMEIADVAVKLIEAEIEQFEPCHAVSGMDVDIAAAIAGLPEDMIDYPLTRVSNVGTTVTVMNDVQCHAGVSTEAIIKRGAVIVALAISLDQAGHQTELWLSDEYTTGKNRVVLRTRVKGANDFIDPAKIMFAYGHPAVQRGLGFCTVAGMPKPWLDIARGGYGHVTGITKDMPEGTLYMDSVFRYNDAPNAEVELRMYLSQLGLLREEDV